MVSCMVVNHEYNEGYQGISWSVDAGDPELLVIHALGFRYVDTVRMFYEDTGWTDYRLFEYVV